MTGRPTTRRQRFYYTFAVSLTETIKISAPSKEDARAALARGFIKHAATSRDIDLEAEPRILKQELRQGEIALLSTEDPMEAILAEERERLGGMTPLEIGQALEDRWQRLEARVAALEAGKK